MPDLNGPARWLIHGSWNEPAEEIQIDQRTVIKESTIKDKRRTRGETWRARAQEYKACFQAPPLGISTHGKDGVVAGKAENH
jgi:hypothetical protein